MFKFILTVSLFFCSAAAIAAQETAVATPTPAPNLETILTEAQKQTDAYREAFRNLLAEETKTVEQFDRSGESDGVTEVKSNFLVYQSGKDANVTSELRNVVAVNGKPVPDSQKRSSEFLAELAKTTTLEKELQKIQKEGSKYDKTLDADGLTLNEGVVLAQKIRPYFDFTLIGAENYQGSEVYVVAYRQTKKSPFVTIDEKNGKTGELSLDFDLDVPDAIKKGEIFLNGKLWIDAKTFQLRREEQMVTAQPGQPLNLLTTVLEYEPSDYEILVPKKITLTFFEFKKPKGSQNYESTKNETLEFDYSKFRQTNVEVKILDEN